MTRLAAPDETIAATALQDPDVRLMLRVRDDDAAGFEELMRRYQNRLVTIFSHLLGGRDQAEDLAQEVFLRVYRSRKRYEPGARFSTWLFTIANNVALNQRRTLSRRREVRVELAASGSTGLAGIEQLAQAASGLMPARQLDRQEMCDVVRTALAALPERQRLAVLLNKFEHLSYAELAAALGLTETAVKSLLARARCTLRDVLEPYFQAGRRPGG